MKAVNVMKDLSKLNSQEMYKFLDFLKMGMEDEWDCKLNNIENFGADEIKLAAKSALGYIESFEKNKK